MRLFIRKIGLFAARMLGSEVKDHQTGHRIGRALLIPWRGKILVIGLEAAVRPIFLPQKRATYWKQELGFTTHALPDFPRLASAEKTETLNSRPQ